MAVRRDPVTGEYDPRAETIPLEAPVMSRAPYEPRGIDGEVLKGRALVLLRDGAWYLRQNRLLLVGAALLPVLLAAFYIGIHVFGDRVFPNVWALGQNIGDMTATDAAAMLQREWFQNTEITLADGDRSWMVTPQQIGLHLDAAATVKDAKSVGLAGFPLGIGITPSVSLDFLTAQTYLLDLSDQTKIQPRNASFRWQGDQFMGVEGSDGRFLDIAATMEALQSSLAMTAETRHFDLIMTTMPPDVRDPQPYMQQAQVFASHSFVIRGYDPFDDESFAWTTDRDTLTSWLEVGTDGLTLRQDVFASFVAAQTQSIEATDEHRYIEPLDSISKMQDAIANNLNEVTVRVRYRSWQYEVESGDTGYRIADKNGVPFYQVRQANPGRDWDIPLTVGEKVNIPSPDIMLPIDPVPNKRIVVNLRTQTLAAFENGQMVRTWSIASGMDRAPTSPGVYEILSHNETAAGGSYELCSAMGCAQWEMYWFMGIYEVVPGLVNGFHGNVLLANGRLLGDGNVGQPETYGCVMSEQEPAEWLYNWAPEGTIVEIINGNYLPRSTVAEQVWNNGART